MQSIETKACRMNGAMIYATVMRHRLTIRVWRTFAPETHDQILGFLLTAHLMSIANISIHRALL